jgi:hypothetical protein
MYKFKITKEDVANQETLLPWLLEQIPLIKAEISQLKATKNRPYKMKRSLDSDSNSNNSPKSAFKTLKLDHQNSYSLLSNSIATQLIENKSDDLVSFIINNEKSLSRDILLIPY